MSRWEYLLRFSHGREEFVEEEELKEEDVETTNACNWLCSVRLTGEDKLPRNSGDRNFTARLFSNKWARTRRSGLLWRQRRRQRRLFKRNSASKHFFSFPFLFFTYVLRTHSACLNIGAVTRGFKVGSKSRPRVFYVSPKVSHPLSLLLFPSLSLPHSFLTLSKTCLAP